ncbi:MAG TPA: hypothetical protein VFF73_41380, partial [Planctomycetota bacterium]|nr:hypothetical protein [Planctomycetota bacterium]
MDEAILRKRLVDLGLIPADKLDDLLRKRPPEDPRTLATLVVEAGLFTRQDLLLLMGGDAEESSDDRTQMAGDRTVNADRTQMAAGNGAQKRTGSFQAAIWPPPDPSSPDVRERISVRDTVQKALALDPLFAPHAELTLLKDRTLGKGGMGVVLLVNDMRLGRLAALKLMKEDGTTVAVQRFLREAAITARLDHPGIPP